MSRNAFRPLALLFTLFLVVPAVSLAQSSKGGVRGTVTDSSGAVLPGVTVTATSVDTGITRQAITTDSGSYLLPLLDSGRYNVKAELTGFNPVEHRNIEVNVATDVTLNIKLSLGLQEEVTVVAETPLIETTRSEQASVVDERLVANLPVNGRNFLDFALTTPGVVRDVRLGDLSFGGQRGTLNSLVVDGANNDNTFFGQALGRTGSGRAPYQFSQDAVREFQINSNAYSAEYGRAGGAVINVVTKSGTNALEGSAFFFYRDKSLNANDYINVLNNRSKGEYQYDQFGASVGGPIVQDEHFFFVNYDGQRNTTPNTVVLNLAGTTPNDADTQAGLARLQSLAESYGRDQNQDVFLVKTDHELFGSHASFRYNRQDFTGVNYENGGITNAVEHTGDSLVKTDTFSANITTPLSGSIFNELRANYVEDSEPGKANSDMPEATIRQNGQTVLTIGRNFFSPRETTIERWQLADAVSLIVGDHSIKGGFDYSADDILNYFPGNFSGSYTFDSIAAYQQGKPSRYVQAFAGPGTTGPTTTPNIEESALFVQDEWRVSSSFTLNAGLRYDYQAIEQPDVYNADPELAAAGIDTSYIPEDDNNVALRLGFAWTPDALGRTVVRAGYGTFYGRTPAIMVGTAHSNNGINVQTITFTGDQVPVYPNIFDSIPSGATVPRPTIFVFDREFENPTVHQASAGLQHALNDDFAVGVSYQYVKGDNLQRSADINVAQYEIVTVPTSDGGTVSYKKYLNARPFNNFFRIIEFQSTANSEYHGATIDVRKRFSRNWEAYLAYTYAEARDDRPDATAVVPGGSDDAKYAEDPLDFDAEWAWSDNDVRHRAVLSGLWRLDDANRSGWSAALLNGWTVSGIVTYQSGQPYSAIVNSDLNNDRNTRNDRAPGIARNSFRNDDFVSVDPRISRDIPLSRGLKLQLIAEAFNVFNEDNVSQKRNVLYNFTNGTLVRQSNFGSPSASAGPRIVQLAAKFIF